MLQDSRAVEIGFEIMFLKCPCHGVYECGGIYNCPRKGCRWLPVVDEVLQQVADDDVWVPEALFQLVNFILVQVFVAGKPFNCCFGFSNYKSL